MSFSSASNQPEIQPALSRAQWSVLQTGLITSGLALFGVYVMATRTNDLHLIQYHWPGAFPTGAMVVGLIASSGYLLASWWFGVRVNAWMLVMITLLQIGTYFIAQYTDFQSQGLIYRETREPASFLRYFQYTSTHVFIDDESVPRTLTTRQAVTRRGSEALAFSLGGVVSALVLVGQTGCAACRGRLHRRELGSIPASRAAEVIPRLEQLAHLEDGAGFIAEMGAYAPNNQSPDDEQRVTLVLYRCEVCGASHLKPSMPPHRAGDIPRAFPAVMVSSVFIQQMGPGPRRKLRGATSRP
jgi:hypothetical protein